MKKALTTGFHFSAANAVLYAVISVPYVDYWQSLAHKLEIFKSLNLFNFVIFLIKKEIKVLAGSAGRAAPHSTGRDDVLYTCVLYSYSS